MGPRMSRGSRAHRAQVQSLAIQSALRNVGVLAFSVSLALVANS